VATVVYFTGVLIALLWPVYPFFSQIFPLVLGVPFGLFYIVFLLILSFLVLLILYLWEDRKGLLE
jgi:hypothetical protein